MLSIFFILLFFQTTLALPLDAWNDYKRQYGKSYATREEDAMRRAIWENSRTEVLRVQSSINNTQSFDCQINQLADLTKTERMLLKGTRPPSSFPLAQKMPLVQGPSSLPPSVNYVSSGCIPAVKNQGTCGSCWAFAATACLEYYNCMKRGRQLTTLSEQNLVDCSTSDTNCRGGFYTSAWDYVKASNGQCREADYPYSSAKSSEPGSCRRNYCSSGGQVSTYVQVDNDEQAMAQAVASIGPIAVSMDAGLSTFDFYSGGVYNDPDCSTNVNHAVVIIGYGTDSKGGDYWLVRNSWSNTWGENGNFRIKRGVNMCGIANYPFYSVV